MDKTEIAKMGNREIIDKLRSYPDLNTAQESDPITVEVAIEREILHKSGFDQRSVSIAYNYHKLQVESEARKRLDRERKEKLNTKEGCRQVALKHRTRGAFQRARKAVYERCRVNGWLDDVCDHMEPQKVGRKPLEKNAPRSIRRKPAGYVYLLQGEKQEGHSWMKVGVTEASDPKLRPLECCRAYSSAMESPAVVVGIFKVRSPFTVEKSVLSMLNLGLHQSIRIDGRSEWRYVTEKKLSWIKTLLTAAQALSE